MVLYNHPKHLRVFVISCRGSPSQSQSRCNNGGWWLAFLYKWLEMVCAAAEMDEIDQSSSNALGYQFGTWKLGTATVSTSSNFKKFPVTLPAHTAL